MEEPQRHDSQNRIIEPLDSTYNFHSDLCSRCHGCELHVAAVPSTWLY